jgi:hypothetical protein
LFRILTAACVIIHGRVQEREVATISSDVVKLLGIIITIIHHISGLIHTNKADMASGSPCIIHPLMLKGWFYSKILV